MAEVDDMGSFVQQWECDAPPKGLSFQVLEDEWDWSGEVPTRIIRRIRPRYVSADRVENQQGPGRD
jgi:hypothetical protein